MSFRFSLFLEHHFQECILCPYPPCRSAGRHQDLGVEGPKPREGYSLLTPSQDVGKPPKRPLKINWRLDKPCVFPVFPTSQPCLWLPLTLHVQTRASHSFPPIASFLVFHFRRKDWKDSTLCLVTLSGHCPCSDNWLLAEDRTPSLLQAWRDHRLCSSPVYCFAW